MPVRSAVIMALLCLFITVPALADNGYNPGFRTLGFWQQESGIRVDVNVWYPSVRAPRSLSYAPWTIRGARNGKPVPGRFPLILLSHPSSGTRFSFHDTAAALAARGFVVAARPPTPATAWRTWTICSSGNSSRTGPWSFRPPWTLSLIHI